MHLVVKTPLYFFLLFLASLSLQAKEQYYIVEVVLFQHLNDSGKVEEFWSKPELIAADLDGSSEFKPVQENPLQKTLDQENSVQENHAHETGAPLNTPLNKLTDDSPALAEYDMQSQYLLPLRNGISKTSAANYRLNDSAAHLRHSPDYKLLAHFGWTQRSFSKKRALPIRITSNQFSDGLIPEGELQLYVSRFLHLQVDLKASQCVYGVTSEETEPANNSQCVNKVYRFKQNRKMRSRELHYIDNPVFGLLVYVTPYAISKN